MRTSRFHPMDLKTTFDIEHSRLSRTLQHDFWPLGEIDPKNSKFPCCLVWTPLPVVSWLAPFIGHVGICREDGTILDFSGSNFINADEFAFGAVARYLQLDRQKCCFPPNLTGHTCKQRYKHSEYGPSVTWDDVLRTSTSLYESKSYNLFTCNCHSFAANCLNRLCYGGTMGWNMVSIACLMLFKAHWVDFYAILRAFTPFVVVMCLGLVMVGWPFLIGLFSFSFLLFLWFILGTYCFRCLLEC